MAKPADITTKQLIGAAPAVWANWTLPVHDITECEVISGEFQWLDRASDAVLRVVSEQWGEFILIIEMQLRYREELPLRLRSYAGLAEEKYRLPVYPVLIVMLPPAAGVTIPDCYESSFLGIEARQDYRVIRLWDVPVTDILNQELLELWSLTPLLQGGKDESVLLRTKQRMLQHVQEHPTKWLVEGEAELATFASFVFPLEVIGRIFGGFMVDWVVESPLYKHVVSQVAETAKEKGWQEGRQEGRMDMLVKVLQGRLGDLGEDLVSRIRSLSSERLEAMADSVFSLKNREELATWLTQENTNGNGVSHS
ncbi:MAG: Rpn family recombination-promoting nuclease/putative transposase [Acidobacteria bacterium]|nr:Rpn family recombination-promoting nuclease/putative transposase [Acidobacteriota bacterium]